MLKLKLPFGFKTIQLDNLYVLFTGKIRVKGNHDLISSRLAHLNSVSISYNHKGYTTISYVTTDRNVHENNIIVINHMLEDIMIDRIRLKYSGNRQTAVIDHHEDLCW